jgi:AraC family transcriptional regulator of adaptative response / DNA-3-methyladenine glycosylase II
LIEDGALDDDHGDTFAARVGLGERQLRRLFRRHLGVSPAGIARVRRTHFAKTLIDGSALPMSEVALGAGFRSIRQFNHAIPRAFGRSPRSFAASGVRFREKRRSSFAPHTDRRPTGDRSSTSFVDARDPGVESVEGETYRRTSPAMACPARSRSRRSRDRTASSFTSRCLR